YYYYRYSDVGETIFKTRYLPTGDWASLHNNPHSASMLLDYSDGTSTDIDENSITESTAFGRSSSSGVDFNGDGDKTDSSFALDLNPTDTPGKTILKDHNDWGTIQLRFSNQSSGLFSIRASTTGLPERKDYLAKDTQEITVCDPTGLYR
ncbi:MAG TPA: hypothetical protein PKN29_09845, partial [Candidatus Ozemobacteraceae bacterium]|nr:hypothetical protein [Candidatus Ozemobacteraceae bacterium]